MAEREFYYLSGSNNTWRPCNSPFTILDIVGRGDMCKVTEFQGTITSCNCMNRSALFNGLEYGCTFVHCDFALLNIILTQTDKNSILSSLSTDWVISVHLLVAWDGELTDNGIPTIQLRFRSFSTTMTDSPKTHRNKPSASIVVGCNMATLLSSEGLSSTSNRLGLLWGLACCVELKVNSRSFLP